MTRSLVIVGVTAALLACSRLPADWQNASGVAAFHQSDCIGSVADLEQGRAERVKLRGDDGRLHVEFLDAHFRCDQRVTAYAKLSDRRVEILVQPVEMNPVTVAKCDCLYVVRFEVRGLDAGEYEVTVHRRWDNRHAPNEPVEIDSDRVSVK